MQKEKAADPSVSRAERGVMKREWDRLPLYAIERILSFLNPHDRSEASIVCKSWAEAYECPDLWRTPVLSFSKHNRKYPCFNPKSVVERFGRYFKTLAVLCRKERTRNQKYVYKQMSEFFRSMEEEEVQLESFRMPRMKVLSKLNKETYEMLTNEEMLSFLRSQTKLATVDFTSGNTHAKCCFEILENLVAENVRHLMLQNVFYEPKPLGTLLGSLRWPRYMAAITRFPHLRSLSLNYLYLSDQIMLRLAESLEGHLETFSILITRCPSSLTALREESWSALILKCPQMRVHFKMEVKDIPTTHAVERNFLPPIIPLTSMYFQMISPWSELFDHIIFDHLPTTYPDTLEDAVFEMRTYPYEDICLGLADLVRNCNSLKHLSLRIRCPIISIDELFDNILDALMQHLTEKGENTLQVFRATFRGLGDEPRGRKMFLMSTYIPRFKEFGVTLKMRMKK